MKLEYAFNKLAERYGVTVNGSEPWDPQVKDKSGYLDVALKGNLGLGEAYMDGKFEVEDLGAMLYKLQAKVPIYKDPLTLYKKYQGKFFNQQTVRKAKRIRDLHYNGDEKIIRKFLGDVPFYTCGFWENAKTLEEAQIAKAEDVCQKLELKPGMTLLDVGCGWGVFLEYAAKNYGVVGVGVNSSEEQLKEAKQRCKDLPVKFITGDYRDLNKHNTKFDRAVSIGTWEFVGHKNMRKFMQMFADHLEDDGKLYLQGTARMVTNYTLDAFLGKYFFPGGELPTQQILAKATEHILYQDLHLDRFPNYIETMDAWLERLDTDGDEREYRKWEYYLTMTREAYRIRSIHFWQQVYTKVLID